MQDNIRDIEDFMQQDKLTGLLYYDDFKEAAPGIIQKLTAPCMLISMNISNFKYVNSMYGYEKGDRLLESIADYFFHGNPYCLLASRVHSDRFVALILISEDVPTESIDSMAVHYDRIHQNFVQEIEQDYPMAVLRINSGAYLIENQEENISEILDKAEFARKNVCDDYFNTICFFTEELEKRAKMEQQMIPTFEHALKEDSILVYLQPKIDVDTQQIVGAEALARLTNEDGNLISPASFIPALEKSGLVVELDMYMARKVFQLLNSWKARGLKLLPVSLNLSRIDFKRGEELVEQIENLELLQVPREYVEFEVTETAFFKDISMITNRVRQLRERGYRISMDDFGTGFSSLNTLGMLPLDCIKFDRGFVQNSINSRKGLEIMAGLVDIFDRINLDVICEGVETSSEEEIVRACGCKRVQGYLHDKPLPVADFETKYLKQASVL